MNDRNIITFDGPPHDCDGDPQGVYEEALQQYTSPAGSQVGAEAEAARTLTQLTEALGNLKLVPR